MNSTEAGIQINTWKGTSIDLAARFFANAVVAILILFLINNYLIFWRDWPGMLTLFANYQWFGLEALSSSLESQQILLGWVQAVSYIGSLGLVAVFIGLTRQRPLLKDAELLAACAAYIVRAAFWAVLIIGLADSLISFLRVEGFLVALIGEELSSELGRPQFRGDYVHFPLLWLSLVIAFFVRSLGFTWLTFLVVIAEFQIVVSRFVFSYEQAFMGDLVRFWYAALFLFASSYTLVHDGHVRVDVLYAHFSRRAKAWSNAVGAVVLGLPICWIIITTGMWGKGHSINSPLLSYEVSQSGYGLYVKYIMVGFLLVFAISMIIQFCSYFLSNVAVLRGNVEDEPEKLEQGDHSPVAS